MILTIFIVRFLLYSIIGYYIFRIITNKKASFYGPIAPFYGLFSLIVLISEKSILFLAIRGMIWGLILESLIKIIDKKSTSDIHIPTYGLLSILNSTILETVFQKIIMISNTSSLVTCAALGSILFLIDISLSLRKSI